MVMFLRGDEDCFGQFSLNADEVMTRLGIKRSRLNQISGKDLRVGRTRIDRYIKPVYRPEDVEAYSRWTRPTATHKSSSKLMEDARARLVGQGQELVSGFKEQVASMGIELRRQAARQELWERRNLIQRSGQLQRTLQSFIRPVLASTRKVHAECSKHFAELLHNIKKFEEIKQSVNEISQISVNQSHELASQRQLIERLFARDHNSERQLDEIKRGISQLCKDQKALKSWVSEQTHLRKTALLACVHGAKAGTLRNFSPPSSATWDRKCRVNTIPPTIRRHKCVRALSS